MFIYMHILLKHSVCNSIQFYMRQLLRRYVIEKGRNVTCGIHGTRRWKAFCYLERRMWRFSAYAPLRRVGMHHHHVKQWNEVLPRFRRSYISATFCYVWLLSFSHANSLLYWLLARRSHVEYLWQAAVHFNIYVKKKELRPELVLIAAQRSGEFALRNLAKIWGGDITYQKLGGMFGGGV